MADPQAPAPPTPSPSAITGKDGKLAAWDPKAGAVVRLTPDELQSSFLSGSHGLISDQEYPMLDPEGKTRLVGSKDVGRALRDAGYKFGNQLDVIRQEQDTPAGQARAFADGALNRATFGFGDAMQVNSGVDPDEIQARKDTWGKTRMAGEFVGAGAVAAVAPEALLGAAPEATAATGLLPQVATAAAGTAVEGAVHGVGDAVSEASLGKTSVTAESLIAHGGLGFALGGALGGALKVPGARALRAADRELLLEGAQGSKPANLADAWNQVQDAYRNGPAVRAAQEELASARGALAEAPAASAPLKNPLKPRDVGMPLPAKPAPGPNTVLEQLGQADVQASSKELRTLDRLHAAELKSFDRAQAKLEPAMTPAAADARAQARASILERQATERAKLEPVGFTRPAAPAEDIGTAPTLLAEPPPPFPAPKPIVKGVSRWYHGSPYSAPRAMGDYQGNVMFLSDSPRVAQQYTKALISSGRRPAGAIEGPGIYEVVPKFSASEVFDTRNPEHLKMFKELARESMKVDPEGGFRPGDMFHVPPSAGGKGVIAGNFPSFGAARELLPLLEKRGFSAAIVGEGGEQGASLAVFAPQKNLRLASEAGAAGRTAPAAAAEEGSTRNLRRASAPAAPAAEASAPGPFGPGGFNNEAFPAPSTAAEEARVAAAESGLGAAQAEIPSSGGGRGGLGARGLGYAAGHMVGGPAGGFIGEQLAASVGNPVRLAALGRAGRVVRDYISDRVGAFANASGRASEAVGLPRIVAPATLAVLNARSGDERRAALANRMEELTNYGDAAGVGDRAAQGTRHIEADVPDATSAVRAKAVQVAAFLRDAAPKPLVVRNPLNPKPSYDLVSDRDAQRFAELDATLQDPLRIVDQLAAGKVPAPEVMAAVRTNYPEVYGHIVQSFQDHISKNPESVSWETAIRASIAFGLSGHPSMIPANLQMQQQAAQAPAGTSAGAPRGSRGGKAPPPRAASYAPPSAASAIPTP